MKLFSLQESVRESDSKVYNKTLTYFNVLKIFLKLFENGIENFKDLAKVNYEYVKYKDADEEKEFNFLTTIFFNIHSLIDKCYLFKISEIKAAR